MMKKSIFTAIFLVCVIVMNFAGSAQDEPLSSEKSIENEIVITSGDLSSEELDLIKQGLENDSIMSPNFNLLCIFGHDLATGAGEYIQHYYYPTTPKCKKSYFTYEYCKRSGCDYSIQTVYKTMYVYCH